MTAGNQVTTCSAGTITTNGGNINFTGTNGIIFSNVFALNSSGGNISRNNGTTLNAALAVNAGSGALTFGSTVDGGNDLTATAGTFSFSSAFGGTTPLSSVSLTSTNGLSLPSITASSIFARTTGAAADITIPVGKVLTASGSNTAITLASGRNFGNSSGSGALSASSGRWLVYSQNPASDTIGSLANDFRRFSCTYGGACPNFPGSGNGLLYTTTPTLTATPSAVGITYGDALSLAGYGYSLSGYLASDSSADSVTGSLTGTSTYSQGSNVGTYNINYSGGSLASALGYSFTYANNANAVTVGKKALTATVQNQSVTYGTATPTLSAANNSHVVWSGLYGSDTGAVLDSITFTYGGATPGSNNNAGSYALSIAAFSDNNYSLAIPGGVTGGTLTVNPYTLTVTADAKGKTYGAGEPALTYTYGALQNGDNAGVFTGALTRAAGENVGNYTITQGTLSAGSNYTISYTSANLSITPASLIITANDKTKLFGAPLPPFDATFTGLANGDTSSVVSGLSLSTVATSGSAVGTYAIVPSGATASNYTISFVDGALTIRAVDLPTTVEGILADYEGVNPLPERPKGELQLEIIRPKPEMPKLGPCDRSGFSASEGGLCIGDGPTARRDDPTHKQFVDATHPAVAARPAGLARSERYSERRKASTRY